MGLYIRLLRNNRDYTKLWLAGAVSQMGDWFNVIVLLSLVSKYTNGSGLAVSLFLLARIIPPLLVTPYAGVLADRLNRKTILIVTDVLRTVIVLMFLLHLFSMFDISASLSVFSSISLIYLFIYLFI